MKYRKAKPIVRFCILLIGLLLALPGCTMLSEERIKLRDLEFTVLSEEKIPAELIKILEEKKNAPFQITYQDQENLYICVGYGEQKTGGYSIAVDELYLTDSSIYVNTCLLGPENPDKINPSVTYPYIVLKTEFLDKTVVFE